ncbi:DMT family transporter [bacterium]|nr:DMT family transporter [bacterium]
MIMPAFLYFLWSLAFPMGKQLVAYAPPIFLTGVRMILGAIFLLGFVAIFQRKSLHKISSKGWLALGIMGFFSIFLTNILEFWSLKELSSAKVCFLYSLSPFLTAILSYFHFKEKLTFRKWIGVGIGILAMVPALIKEGVILSISLPELSMFFAVFFAVYGWIVLRMLVKDNQISPAMANGVSMLLGGVLSLLVSFGVDSWNPTPVQPGVFGSFSITLVALTIISNVICYNLYGYLLKKYTATILSFFGLLSPIFASIHGYFLLGEPISPVILLSTAIVLIGLTLVYGEELRLGYIKKSSEKALGSNSPQKA